MVPVRLILILVKGHYLPRTSYAVVNIIARPHVAILQECAFSTRMLASGSSMQFLAKISGQELSESMEVLRIHTLSS